MDILEKIAFDLAKHKLVPFIGAGISFEHLSLNWDILCSKLNNETGIDEKDNLIAAQHYVNQFGKVSFVNFLKKHLLIDNFDDKKGESALFLLALNSPHYYTTNQDNVLEKCLEKYNRKYQKLSTIATFQNMYPNITTILKFHGDLEYPESVVYTKTDYLERMPKNKELANYNPLDIMLIADTISRGCLFIGYSFRDPNVIEIFEHLSMIFSGNLPKSYLIEYKPNVGFEDKLKKYNIECINCSTYFSSMNNAEAYSSVLSFLIKKSFEYKTQDEMKTIVSTEQYSIIPILSSFELKSFNNYLDTTDEKIDNIIDKFRALTGRYNIPKDLSECVGKIIKKIIISVDTIKSFSNIKCALHDINIFDVGIKMDIMIEYYYKLNDFSISDVMENIHLYSIHMRGIHSNSNIVFATLALDKLSEDGKNPRNLLYCLSCCIGSLNDIEELEPDTQEYIKYQFNKHYSVTSDLRNPLSESESSFVKIRTYEDILDDLMNMMPKSFK